MKKLMLFTITALSFNFSFAATENSISHIIDRDKFSSPSKMDTTNEARRARQAAQHYDPYADRDYRSSDERDKTQRERELDRNSSPSTTY
jgi:hypothetical protein